jgi:anti-sigma regulatory factor (Ser/Thr protein kinase)
MRNVAIDFTVDDTFRSIHAMLARLADPQHAYVSDDVLVDLSRCKFLGPSAVVTLAGLRRLAVAGGRTMRIVPPTLSPLINYCRYSGLLAEFGEGPAPDRHPPGENVTIPLEVFSDRLDLEQIRRVVLLAKQQMSLSSTAEDDLKIVLAELVQNVLDHSLSPVGGIISARAYSKDREVRFSVADMGVGIRASLSRRYAVTSDAAAIRKALQERVTGRSSQRNLGLGLSNLHAIVRSSRGQMVIYSRNGYLGFDGGRDRVGLAKVPFPGTIVYVRLPARDIKGDVDTTVDVWG